MRVGAEAGVDVDWETDATAHSRDAGSHELERGIGMWRISIVRRVRRQKIKAHHKELG